MGLFDLFKKKSSSENMVVNAQPEQNFQPAEMQAKVAEPYLGDLEKTRTIHELIKTPRSGRDATWQKDFLQNVSQASFQCGDPQVISGPDGFPYFQLFLPEPNQQFQCYVIDRMKDDFLLNLGYGVVVNPIGEQPEWVFTYGDIVNLHINHVFYTSDKTDFSKNGQDEVIQEKEEVLIGQPSEYILPAATRQILSGFLQARGINTPKVVLMQRKDKATNAISQDLVFNITPDNFANEEDYRAVMQHLAWFLPRHYALAGMRESALPEFEPL
jgi:hypothetical protein